MYGRQPSSEASIAGRSSFMVLAIGFGPNNSLSMFETALSQNTFWYTSYSLDFTLSAQLLPQNIPNL